MTGYQIKDIVEQSRKDKVSMIEVNSIAVAKEMKQQEIFKMNYIFIQPHSIEEVKKRLIRERVGSESDKSL